MFRIHYFLLLHTLTASRRIVSMFPWKTVGMHDPSSSSPAICVPRTEECRNAHRTRPVQMTSCTNLVLFNTFEELNLPIKGPMEEAGVVKAVKLYVSTWLQPKIWLAESPLSPCFWQETLLQQSLTSTASARIQTS